MESIMNINNLLQALRNAGEQIAQLEGNTAKLAACNTELAKESQEVSNARYKAEREVDRLKEVVAKQASYMQVGEDKIAHWMKQADDWKNSYTKSSNGAEELQRKLDQLKEVCTANNSTIQMSNSRAVSYKTQLDTMRDVYASSIDANTKLKIEIQRREARLAVVEPMPPNFERMVAAIKDRDCRIELLESKLKTPTKELEDLKREVARDLIAARMDIRVLEGTMKGLDSDLLKTTAKIESLESELYISNSIRANIEADNEKLDQELGSLRGLYEDNTNAMKDSLNKIASLKKDIADRPVIQLAKAEEVAEINRLRGLVEMNNDYIEASKRTTDNVYTGYEKEIADLNTIIAQLRKELANKTTFCKVLHDMATRISELTNSYTIQGKMHSLKEFLKENPK